MVGLTANDVHIGGRRAHILRRHVPSTQTLDVSADDYVAACRLHVDLHDMKSATRLQFSKAGRIVLRAAGWVAVTMVLGLMLSILTGRPLTASTSTVPSLPGGDHSRKTGPWVYQPVSYRV